MLSETENEWTIYSNLRLCGLLQRLLLCGRLFLPFFEKLDFPKSTKQGQVLVLPVLPARLVSCVFGVAESSFFEISVGIQTRTLLQSRRYNKIQSLKLLDYLLRGHLDQRCDTRDEIVFTILYWFGTRGLQ